MRKLVVILIFLLVIILALAGFLVYNIYGFGPSKEPTTNLVDINKTTIGTTQIYYLLYSIKAYELHSPPFSSNTPKINIQVGNQEYQAEVIDKNINVQQGTIENPDLKISCQEDEFIKLLNSRNFNLALQESVKSGNTGIDIIAGKTELFTKGYLSLYKEVTGMSLTGNFLRVSS